MRLSVAIQTPEVDRDVPVALLAGTFEERLAKARDLGLDGVELMTSDPASLDAGHLRARLAAAGLEASAVGSGAVPFCTGLTLLDADREKAALAGKRLDELIQFAAEIRAPLVTIGSFRGWLSSAGGRGSAELVRVLREGATHAEARGVRLALEPLNRYESDTVNNAEEGLAFLSEIDHPSLGLLLDTYHVNIEERSWAAPFGRLLSVGKLWHVHLGDNNRMPPGQGLIDFGSIVAILRESGYTGYLSAEHLALPDPDVAARQTVAYMRSIIEV